MSNPTEKAPELPSRANVSLKDATIREWLAGEALAFAAGVPEKDAELIAKKAVEIADAVLRRLEATKPPPPSPQTRGGTSSAGVLQEDRSAGYDDLIK